MNNMIYLRKCGGGRGRGEVEGGCIKTWSTPGPCCLNADYREVTGVKYRQIFIPVTFSFVQKHFLEQFSLFFF